jgi:AraC-like DNA-binding protein
MNKNNNVSDERRASQKLYIKYMVSSRCRMIVQNILNKKGVKHSFEIHGSIQLNEKLTPSLFSDIEIQLHKSGFIPLSQHDAILIDRIIQTIIDLVHKSEELPRYSFFEIINRNLDSTSNSILKTFSDVMGMSVIQFILKQKVERIKEMLLYEDVSLTEISEMLNYESESLMVAQFRKHTGLTPVYFKKMKRQRDKIARHNAEEEYHM